MLDTFAYNMGYWTARSGQPGVFVSASMRIGFQHGSVARARDSEQVRDSGLRECLRGLSVAHEAWYAAAKAGDRTGQHEADVRAKALMLSLIGEEAVREASPALWARVHLAPGINLVL